MTLLDRIIDDLTKGASVNVETLSLGTETKLADSHLLVDLLGGYSPIASAAAAGVQNGDMGSMIGAGGGAQIGRSIGGGLGDIAGGASAGLGALLGNRGGLTGGVGKTLSELGPHLGGMGATMGGMYGARGGMNALQPRPYEKAWDNVANRFKNSSDTSITYEKSATTTLSRYKISGMLGMAANFAAGPLLRKALPSVAGRVGTGIGGAMLDAGAGALANNAVDRMTGGR